MKKEQYRDILKKHLKQSVRKLGMSRRFKFVQDNDPKVRNYCFSFCQGMTKFIFFTIGQKIITILNTFAVYFFAYPWLRIFALKNTPRHIYCYKSEKCIELQMGWTQNCVKMLPNRPEYHATNITKMKSK